MLRHLFKGGITKTPAPTKGSENFHRGSYAATHSSIYEVAGGFRRFTSYAHHVAWLYVEGGVVIKPGVTIPSDTEGLAEMCKLLIEMQCPLNEEDDEVGRSIAATSYSLLYVIETFLSSLCVLIF
jgi:hypothetical protein